MDLYLTLEETVTRAQMNALLAAGTAVPKRKYRITDAVEGEIEVYCQTPTELYQWAISVNNHLFGRYQIDADAFSPMGVLNVNGVPVKNNGGGFVTIYDNCYRQYKALHGFGVGEAIAIDGTGAYVRASTASLQLANVVGIVKEVQDINNFWLATVGFVDGLAGYPATAGTTYYLHPSTPGAITATEPTAANSIYKRVIMNLGTQAGIIINEQPKIISQATQADLFAISVSPHVLTATTAPQKILNSSTNGAVAVEAATYYDIECVFDVSLLSAVSGSFSFVLGGTAGLTIVKLNSAGTKSSGSVAQTPLIGFSNTNSIAVSSNNTNTNGQMMLKGRILTILAGTIIPQIILGVASPAVIGVGAFFKIQKLGTQNTQGTWS